MIGRPAMLAADLGLVRHDLLRALVESMTFLAAILAVDTLQPCSIIGDECELLRLFGLLDDRQDHTCRMLECLFGVATDQHMQRLSLFLYCLRTIQHLLLVVDRLFLAAFTA